MEKGNYTHVQRKAGIAPRPKGRPWKDAAPRDVVAEQAYEIQRLRINTKQGVLYLSMIRDLYDNSIAACKTGTEQTVDLVLDTIRLAMKQEKKKVAAELRFHSDQDTQYASQTYFELTQIYGITPSMSRRGTPYDNE